MSFLSRIMKPIVRKSINQKTPMPPRRKGGLAGLIQRVKDKRLERPISVGGVGGGLGISKSPLAQAAEKLRNSIQPVPVSPVQARRQELENLGYDSADVQEILERDQVRGLGNITSNVLPTVTPPIAPPPVDPPILQRPIIPPRRGIIGSNPIIESGTGGIGARPDLPQLPRSSLFGGKGMRDDFMFIERLEDPIKDIQPPVIPDTTPPPVALPPIVTPDPVIEPAPTTPAAVATDVGAVTDTTMPVGALDPVLLGQTSQETITDPLVRALYFGTQDQPGFYQQLQQAGANLIGQDVPLQQTAGLTPLELLARQQAVAGLGGFEPFLQQNRQLVEQAIDQSRRAEELRDPYYGIAEQQLQTGLGEELGGIGQARGITTGATDRFGRSLGGLGRQAIGSTAQFGGRLGESEDLFRGTVGGYDQGLTQQFYNPFEDAVVQRTIEDVMEAGDKQDIASRAREISAGAFGGSRARLGAQERREALGEGLAKALGSIRQQGFSEAQRTGLSEFARQRAAERAAASGLSGLATSRLGAQQQLGSTLRGLTGDQFAAQQQLASNLMGYGAAGSQARQNLASGMLGIGQQRGAGASALGQQLAGYGSQIGGIGSTQEGLRAGQRGELAGFGGIGRGIAETGLSRMYQQQLGQQQRPLGVLGQIGSMLPGYQQTSTQIGSQYGLPTDPSAAGLGAAFSAYGALAPRQGQS